MQKTAFACVVAALILVSCATQGNQNAVFFDKAPLFGMIYDEDNQPCAEAKLTVDGAAASGETGLVTDIRGRFVLPELARGEHTLVVRKDGYEELSLKVVFQHRTDVLFLKMVSFGQLLTNVEKALEQRKWDEADAFLARAEKLGAGDAVLLYLRAVEAFKIEKYEAAAGYLNSILDKGIKEPAVYLFLADLYERNLSNPQKAIENLEAYLTRRADADAQKRLGQLKVADKK